MVHKTKTDQLKKNILKDLRKQFARLKKYIFHFDLNRLKSMAVQIRGSLLTNLGGTMVIKRSHPTV